MRDSSTILFLGLLAVLLLQASDGGARVFARPRRRATADEKQRVLDAVEKLGYPRDEVEKVIQFESGWNPAARYVNPETGEPGAVGLIQFLPKSLPGVLFNGTADDFAKLSVDEQLPYILRQFKASRWQVPGDTYLAVFSPAAVGAPDHLILWRKGSRAWKQNPGLRGPNNGDITAGSVRWFLLKHLPARFEP